MRWFERGLWKAGIIALYMLCLLSVLLWFSASVASAHEANLQSAASRTVIVQATPTADATITALTKERLQHENDWWWNYGAMILTSLISTLTLAAAGVFTVVRYFNDRRDTRTKQEEEAKRQADDHKSEREKRAEERFQAVVEGLGSEREEAKVGAAITLRTFLRPGYEEFYTQTFDLVVAHLRLPRTAHPPEDPTLPLPLTTLNQALIIVFREAFPLARSQNQKSPQSLDATGVQLDNAYLWMVDLEQVWMREAFLRNANLYGANLSRATLTWTNLSGANLRTANLSEAHLRGVNLSAARLMGATLRGARLDEADLRNANLSGADLRGARFPKTNLEDALSLEAANLRGATGLTKEQLEACKAKGALVDQDPTTSSSQPIVNAPSPAQNNDVPASPMPSFQASVSVPKADENNVIPPQLDTGS